VGLFQKSVLKKYLEVQKQSLTKEVNEAFLDFSKIFW